MEEEKLLRWIIISCFLIISSSASAQNTDAWLEQVLTLKREGWGERISPVLPDQKRPTPPLIAFVSFSMPEDSLKAILEQVDRAGGTVVLRGLVNDSFKNTARGSVSIPNCSPNMTSIPCPPSWFRTAIASTRSPAT